MSKRIVIDESAPLEMRQKLHKALARSGSEAIPRKFARHFLPPDESGFIAYKGVAAPKKKKGRFSDDGPLYHNEKISESAVDRVLANGLSEHPTRNPDKKLMVILNSGFGRDDLLAYLSKMRFDTPVWDAFVAAEARGFVKMVPLGRIHEDTRANERIVDWILENGLTDGNSMDFDALRRRYGVTFNAGFSKVDLVAYLAKMS
ncbi:MAG: hypothetical protein V1827_06445, partial [Candidatus Micrarchaeota archaeon]